MSGSPPTAGIQRIPTSIASTHHRQVTEERTRESPRGQDHAGEAQRSGPSRAITNLNENVQGSQAWNSIFRPGSIFRKGYSDSPRNRSRDHELGALPPPPGEGEAPCGQGELHALPRWAELLPLHPAHGHGHLPDVLLPPDGHQRLGRHLRPADLGDAPPPGAQHASMGRPPHGAVGVPPHGPSSTTVPTRRPASSTGSSA